MKPTILLVLLSLAMGGCVNAETRYVSDKGQMVQCSGVGFGIIGSIVTEVAYQKCKKFYRDTGWREVPDKP